MAEVEASSCPSPHGVPEFPIMKTSQLKDAKPTSITKRQKTKNRKKINGGKKPKDMPRRVLSAYNIFFQEQRTTILKELKTDIADHRNLFATLARIVAQRWKALSKEGLEKYNKLSQLDEERFSREMDLYQQNLAKKSHKTSTSPEIAKKKQDRQVPRPSQLPLDFMAIQTTNADKNGTASALRSTHAPPPAVPHALEGSQLRNLLVRPQTATQNDTLTNNVHGIGSTNQQKDLDLLRLLMARGQNCTAQTPTTSCTAAVGAIVHALQQQQQQQQLQQNALRLAMMRGTLGNSPGVIMQQSPYAEQVQANSQFTGVGCQVNSQGLWLPRAGTFG